MMNEKPILFNTEMVTAILDGRKTQTRRAVEDSSEFIYSITDDYIHAIHKGSTNENEKNTSITKRRLQSWVGWTNLLANEIQRIWQEGTRGMVSAKRVPDEIWLPDSESIPQREKGNQVSTSSGLHGIPRDAESEVFNGKTFGWRPQEQLSREFKMGNADRELGRQGSSREGTGRREAPDGETIRSRMCTFEMGIKKWSVQPASGSSRSRNVTGWNISHCKKQVGMILYVREKFCYGSVVCGDSLPEEQDPIYIEQLVNDKDVIPYEWAIRNNVGIEEVKWKPSIHMHKKYSRIKLKITDIRVERLQDISPFDCHQEGLISDWPSNGGDAANPIWPEKNHRGLTRDQWRTMPELFAELWDSIYKTWDDNPWVWSVAFERCNSRKKINQQEEI